MEGRFPGRGAPLFSLRWRRVMARRALRPPSAGNVIESYPQKGRMSGFRVLPIPLRFKRLTKPFLRSRIFATGERPLGGDHNGRRPPLLQ